MKKKPTKTFLLLLGTPRSGTSLLAAMLGRHPEVAMLHEEFGRAIRRLVGKRVVGNKLCVPNHIEMHRRRPRWVRLFGQRLFYLLHRHGYFTYRPEACLSIEDYLQWTPLKIIATLRDGNAVISSIQKRGKQSQEVALHRWRRGIEILFELQQRGEDLLLISFERLVSEPEEAMHATADHLELDFHPAMLEGYAYTPNYNNKKIDSSKAKKTSSVQNGLDLADRCPEAYEKYQTLHQRCTIR